MTLQLPVTARRPATGLWLILAAIYLFFIAKNYRFQLDDALIYLRYIENALAGHGLVYNPGVRFNGLTSPLFSYLVLAVAWLTGSAQLGSFLVSAVALFLAAIVTARLFESAISESALIAPQVFAWLGAALMLFLPYFYLTFGMETGLYTLLSSSLILLMRERRYRVAGVCAALLFLTRSEGAFLILAVAAFDLVRQRRLPPFSFATYVAPLLIVGAVFAANYFYYGSPLPQTGMAKIWQGTSGLWGEHLGYLQVGYLYGFVFDSNPLTPITYVVFVCAGFAILRDRHLIGVILLYLVLYCSFYLALNIPNYHWYYSPFFAFGPFFAAAGIDGVLTALRRMERGRRGWVLMAIFAAPVLLLMASNFAANSVARGGIDSYRAIGQWMKANLGEETSIAMVEIGTVGYYSQRNIVDILGLVNPDNAKFIGERRFDAWLDEYPVTHLLVHEPTWDHEVSVYGAGLSRHTTEDCRFKFPGYRLYQIGKGGADGLQTCDPAQAYHVSLESPGDASATLREGRGHIDDTRVVGNFLMVYGWARGAGDQSFDEARYHGPGGGRLIWKRMDRADVATHFAAPSLGRSGFSGAIRFDTYKEAQAALQSGCVLVRGEAGVDAALLPLRPDNVCR